MTKKDQEEEEVEIATCTRGQYFGELALVTNKPRAASAYAVGSVKCLGKFVQSHHSCCRRSPSETAVPDYSSVCSF